MGKGRDLSKIYCLDIESTCWADADAIDGLITQVQPLSEIIEIGLSELIVRGDHRGKITKLDSIFVKPMLNPILSDFCKELTGITQEQVDKGMDFDQACNMLRTVHHTQNWTMASWGFYDFNQFQKQCRDYPYPNKPRFPWSTSHINVKLLYGLLREQELMALDKAAINEVGSFEGSHHSGGDDAYNVARILRGLLNAY